MTEPAPSLASNARWSVVSQVGRSGLRTLGLVVLSRLLAPTDFGLIAMATVIINFGELARDMGTSAVLIQREELDDDTTCTVFWFNTVAGLGLGIAVFALAPLLAGFFAEPDLAPMLQLLAVVFPIGGLATAHQALLQRASRFRVIAGVELLAIVLGLLVAVPAAWLGAGAFSLVYQILAATLVSSACVWRASGWTPRLRWSSRRFRSMWTFSGPLFGFNILHVVSRSADDWMLGRFLGAGPLGVYSLAYRVMMVPIYNLGWIVDRALFPILSQRRREPGAAADLYRRSLTVTALLATPVAGGLWVAREPLMVGVFGEQWRDAAVVLAWLAPIGLIESLFSTTWTVMKSYGRTDLLGRVGLLGAVLLPTAFLIGLQWGLIGLAAGYLIGLVLLATPAFVIAVRLTGNSGGDLLRALGPPLVLSCLMVLACRAVDLAWLGAGADPYLRLLTFAVVGVLAYAGLLKLFLPDSLTALRSLVPRPR